jgi:hypothetical protein
MSKSCPECSAEFYPANIRNNQELIRCMRIIGTQGLKSNESSSTMQVLLPPCPPLPPYKSAGQAPLCQFCQDAPATSVCQDCPTSKTLCDECFAFRHKKEATQGHKHVPWSAKLTNPVCAEHNHECLMFCRQDQIAICTLCTFGRHKGHDVFVTSDESAACKERMRAAVGELEAMTREVQAMGQKVSERFEEITGRSPLDTSKVGTVNHGGGTSYAAILAINRRFDDVLDLLERRRRELIDQVHAISARKSAELTEQMDANSIYVARNYSVCFNTRKCMEQESDVYLLENESGLLCDISRQIALRENVCTAPATSSNIRFVDTMDSGIEELVRTLGEIIAHEVDASRCELAHSNRLDDVIVNEDIVMSLHVVDRAGQRMSEGGEDVSCAIRSVPLGDIVEDTANVVDCGNGSYTVTVRFIVPGDFTMCISVGGVQITGSPYTFTVRDIRRLQRGFIGNGKGSGAGQFDAPAGICSDNSLLFVSECDNEGNGGNRVQVFRCDGSYVRSIGNGKGSDDDQFNVPLFLCCADGLLYVCDCANYRVQVFRCEDGSYVRSIGNGKGSDDGQFARPVGLCCADGLLYVCDCDNHRVQVFRCDDGSYVRSISFGKGSGDNQFNNLAGICCADGMLYVCANYRVQVFRCDGSYVRSIGNGKGNGDGQYGSHTTPICCHNGLLYVTDPETHRMQVFRCEDGSYVRSIGNGKGSDDGQFDTPFGVCCAHGVLYVCDHGNYRVYVSPVIE